MWNINEYANEMVIFQAQLLATNNEKCVLQSQTFKQWWQGEEEDMMVEQ